CGRSVRRENGLKITAVRKLDVLDAPPTINTATGYRLGDKNLTAPPASLHLLAACAPVYEEWPGWMTTTAGITQWRDLPENARCYLKRIEELLEAPLAAVSTGPGRGETIHLRQLRVVPPRDEPQPWTN